MITDKNEKYFGVDVCRCVYVLMGVSRRSLLIALIFSEKEKQGHWLRVGRREEVLGVWREE